MKTLVTGAGGFAGRHLIRELAGNGHEALALDVRFASPVEDADATFTADLRNRSDIFRIVSSVKPEACIHLGAVSFVPTGAADPVLMLSVNIDGTVSILDAIREHAPSCRLLVVSSAYVYDPAQTDQPLPETAPLTPITLYAISKAAADLATLAYAKHFRLPFMTVRPTNHTGPGQSTDFVVASFVEQIRDIARGNAAPVLMVGNLESQRAIADVRDVARAYRLIVEKGRPGEAYNVSASRAMRIADMLDSLCRLAGVNPERRVDPHRFRPTDRSPILDISKVQQHTGWTPQIEFSQTLKDMLQSG
jgi:GDP-4-dehydro-6-deoxy-D-mannose reductase